MANPLYQKHIISINDLSREDLETGPGDRCKTESEPTAGTAEA